MIPPLACRARRNVKPSVASLALKHTPLDCAIEPMNVLEDEEEGGRLRFLGSPHILQREMNSLADAQILLLLRPEPTRKV